MQERKIKKENFKKVFQSRYSFSMTQVLFIAVFHNDGKKEGESNFKKRNIIVHRVIKKEGEEEEE